MTAQQKFGRQYQFVYTPHFSGIGPPTAPVTIQQPITAHFWVERNIQSELNRMSIEMYNLSQPHRKTMYQDRFNISQQNMMTFNVGYSTLYRAFYGRVFEASSAREGVNIVTRVEGRDGQFDTETTLANITIDAGRTIAQLFAILCGLFPNLKVGAIGNWPTVLTRSVVLNGNAWKLIQQYSNGLAYIDSGLIYIMNETEVAIAKVGAPVPSINVATGLLFTPRRDEGSIWVTTLMEASIKINTLVNLQNSVQKEYDGQYKVIGFRHQGTISGAVCGECYSTFQLLAPPFYGAKAFTQIVAKV